MEHRRNWRTILRRGYILYISFGQRRRKAGTEVKSLVGEGDETFFGIQVCNVCISHKTKPVEMLGRCFWNADATQVTSCSRCRSGFHQVWLWISILRLTTSSATVLQVWQISKRLIFHFLLDVLSLPKILCFTEGSNWKILKAEHWIFTIFKIFKD